MHKIEHTKKEATGEGKNVIVNGDVYIDGVFSIGSSISGLQLKASSHKIISNNNNSDIYIDGCLVVNGAFKIGAV